MSIPDHLTSLRKGLHRGYNPVLHRTEDSVVGLDFGLHLLGEGSQLDWHDPCSEAAFLVIQGEGTLEVDDRSLAFQRASWITAGPFVAHFPCTCRLKIRAETDCEIAQVCAENGSSFTPRLIGPDEVATDHRGKGMLEDTAYRIVRTIFDRASAPPESKLVLGEVVSLPGRWSSYPPHHHPQPEVYYYRFSPEQGYGHGELGGQVFSLRHHDLLRITDDRDHSQVSAPGYHMYYLWAIRHLDGAPYTGFEYNPTHRWLLEQVADG